MTQREALEILLEAKLLEKAAETIARNVSSSSPNAATWRAVLTAIGHYRELLECCLACCDPHVVDSAALLLPRELREDEPAGPEVVVLAAGSKLLN
jgi:hypothetical protein